MPEQLPFLSHDEDGLIFALLVQPKASRAALVGLFGTQLKVAVTAPPESGKANAATVALLAKALGVAPSQVEVLAGHTGRSKRLRVRGLSLAAARVAIERALQR